MIRGLRWFADLPDATVGALAGLAIPHRREAGEVVFLEGDPAAGMFVVLSGRVKIVRTSAAGREQVLHVVEAGDHFNAVPVFDGGPTPADAIALTDVELILLPRDGLRSLIDADPALAAAFLSELAGRMRHLVGLVDSLALHTVQGRLARLLLTQAEAADRGEPVSPLTQAEMAARLGTVREMVGRTLKTFEALGLVRIERGAMVVTDRAGLEEQAES